MVAKLKLSFPAVVGGEYAKTEDVWPHQKKQRRIRRAVAAPAEPAAAVAVVVEEAVDL